MLAVGALKDFSMTSPKMSNKSELSDGKFTETKLMFYSVLKSAGKICTDGVVIIRLVRAAHMTRISYNIITSNKSSHTPCLYFYASNPKLITVYM